MADEEYTPYGDHPPTPELTALRLRAEQLCRDGADAALLDLVPRLRDDAQWWPHLWGPSAAIAARRRGRADALDLLGSAVDAGFSQPELFEGVLEEHFGTDPSWGDLMGRMAANVPAPSLLLTDWPDPAPALPLELDLISDSRADELRRLLPDPVPGASAWATATMLLEWVRRRWEHANDHVSEPDAIDVLERVDAGERFACVEYSIVLSQALNALRIPARRLSLRQRHHHVGVGRGHVVSEAWIDDLDRWVVLDGQNAASWVDEEGRALGVLELQQAMRDDEPVRMVGLVDELSERESATWLTYFASVTTTGYTWAAEAFSPVFQGVGIVKTGRLLRDAQPAYPVLSDIAVGTSGSVARPVLTMSTPHPYATGFRVVGGGSTTELLGQPGRWELDLTPGEHRVEISVVTDYGVTAPRVVSYDVAPG